MLKTILVLGTGIALGCYYKSHKDNLKLSSSKKESDHDDEHIKSKKDSDK